jgi:hypothetical protein
MFRDNGAEMRVQIQRQHGRLSDDDSIETVRREQVRPSMADVLSPARQASEFEGVTGSPDEQQVLAAPRTSRKPQNQEYLRKLRVELAAISPQPNPAMAYEEIMRAMERALLPAWTLPVLQKESRDCKQLDDGTYRLKLVSHRIYFNPWGAFCIIDKLALQQPYFQLCGAGDRGFVLPAGEEQWPE